MRFQEEVGDLKKTYFFNKELAKTDMNIKEKSSGKKRKRGVGVDGI